MVFLISLKLCFFVVGLLVFNKFSGLTRPQVTVFNIVARNYAARKGTREKARKKKVKVEVVKTGFIPHNQRGLDK